LAAAAAAATAIMGLKSRKIIISYSKEDLNRDKGNIRVSKYRDIFAVNPFRPKTMNFLY
jgi:hypothetical protein